MDPETLVKLIDAGFTKQEILELTGKTITEPAPAAPASAPDPAPAPAAPASAQDPAPASQDGNNIESRLDGIENSLKDMMKQFQAENLRRDSFEHAPSESLEAQTDKIMMSIIRPEQKGSA